MYELCIRRVFKNLNMTFGAISKDEKRNSVEAPNVSTSSVLWLKICFSLHTWDENQSSVRKVLAHYQGIFEFFLLKPGSMFLADTSLRDLTVN